MRYNYNMRIRIKGFTLVEVIVSIAVFVVIMVAVSAFQYNVTSYNRSSSTALSNTTEAQSILKTIARELRSMEPSGNGAYPIAQVSTSSITFFADTDANGTKDQIRYYLATTTLFRGMVTPTGNPPVYNQANENISILATGIRNANNFPVFEYFDSTYAGTSTPLSYPLTITTLRSIKVNITIDSDPNKSPVPRTFSTQATLRNLKDNL